MKISHAYKISIICVMFVIVLLPYFDLAGENASISVEQSEKIINKIYEKYIPVYKKYTGIESLRKIDIIEYNPNSITLINRSHVSVIRKDYFYKKPEITILRYLIDDDLKRPSDYQSREIEPYHLVLDEQGKNLYLTRIMQSVTVSNQKCYQMQVTPREKTPEHFEGYMYFRMDSLDLYLIEGTLGNLPYSFTEYSMKQYFDHLIDLPVLKSGSCIMRMYIPVLQPDRRFVFSVKVITNKLLVD